MKKAWYKLIITALLVQLITISCEKGESPKVGVETEVFRLDGSINGATLSLIAGANDYYMHTEFAKDTNDVFAFKGILGPSNCNENTSCKNSLSITIRDGKTSASQASHINEFLTPNSFLYRSQVDTALTAYKVEFKSEIYGAAGNNYNYHWDFGDGNASNSPNPTHTYTTPIVGNWLTPCLKITNTNSGEVSNLCNEIYFPGDCNIDFKYYYDSSKTPTIAYNILNSGGVVSSEWNFFGNGWSTSPDVSSWVTSPQKVCLRVKYSDSCESMKCKNVIADSTYKKGVANFDFIKTPIYTKNYLDFSKVTIKWIDQNGKEYSSDSFEQEASSNFIIKKVDDYSTNRKGSDTKKVDVEFSCRLYGSSKADYIDLANIKGTFGLAHP